MAVCFMVMVVAFAVGMIAMLFMSLRFVAAAFAVCVRMCPSRFIDTRFVVVAATVTVSMIKLVSVRFGAMTATFTVLMSVFVGQLMCPRFVDVSAAFAMPVAASVFIGMAVHMPFRPVGTGFGLFRAVGFGKVGVRHGWLPGSICGLVNTLKPLQGQGRNPEGP